MSFCFFATFDCRKLSEVIREFQVWSRRSPGLRIFSCVFFCFQRIWILPRDVPRGERHSFTWPPCAKVMPPVYQTSCTRHADTAVSEALHCLGLSVKPPITTLNLGRPPPPSVSWARKVKLPSKGGTTSTKLYSYHRKHWQCIFKAGFSPETCWSLAICALLVGMTSRKRHTLTTAYHNLSALLPQAMPGWSTRSLQVGPRNQDSASFMSYKGNKPQIIQISSISWILLELIHANVIPLVAS